MANNSAFDLRGATDEELVSQLHEAKQELFNLRFQVATGQLDNNKRLKTVRHDIARIYTVMRERELGITYEAADADADSIRRQRSTPRRQAHEYPRRGSSRCAKPRGNRKVREGLVVSDKMTKTVVVEVEDRVQHPLYGKTIRRTTRYKAHDEGDAAVGDRVLLMETRPVSATKRWRVVEILERAR